MSTTLYAHVEVKHEGTWHHFSSHTIHKNYLLCAAIDGTRADSPSVAARKPVPQAKRHGLPGDATAVTLRCLPFEIGPGGRHVVTLDAGEIKAVQDELYRCRPEIARTGIDELDFEASIFHVFINGNAIASHTGFEDVRMICAFDGT